MAGRWPARRSWAGSASSSFCSRGWTALGAGGAACTSSPASRASARRAWPTSWRLAATRGRRDGGLGRGLGRRRRAGLLALDRGGARAAPAGARARRAAAPGPRAAVARGRRAASAGEPNPRIRSCWASGASMPCARCCRPPPSRRLVVMLEDLHAADRASLLALQLVARALREPAGPDRRHPPRRRGDPRPDVAELLAPRRARGARRCRSTRLGRDAGRGLMAGSPAASRACSTRSTRPAAATRCSSPRACASCARRAPRRRAGGRGRAHRRAAGAARARHARGARGGGAAGARARPCRCWPTPAAPARRRAARAPAPAARQPGSSRRATAGASASPTASTASGWSRTWRPSARAACTCALAEALLRWRDGRSPRGRGAAGAATSWPPVRPATRAGDRLGLRAAGRARAALAFDRAVALYEGALRRPRPLLDRPARACRSTSRARSGRGAGARGGGAAQPRALPGRRRPGPRRWATACAWPGRRWPTAPSCASGWSTSRWWRCWPRRSTRCRRDAAPRCARG